MKSDIFLTKKREFFESIEKDIIFLFDKKSSNEFWIKYIDKKHNNFFRFKDDNFIIKYQKFILNIDFDEIELINSLNKLFLDTLFWNENDIIYFCSNSDNIIETKLGYLIKYFDDFLSYKDECPIIYNYSQKKQYLYYTYHGDFYLSTSSSE